MKNKSQNQGTRVRIIVKTLALTVIVFGLSACGHHPPKEVTQGDQFLGKRTVKMVYQADHAKSQHRESTPMKKGDEFEIVRQSGTSNKFRIVPGKNFKGDTAWADLSLEYRPGIETNKPVPLIAEICANDDQTTEQAEGTAANQTRQYDYIKANVQNDFLNLDGRGLEFLEGGPIVFNGIRHTIHIFHIVKIGAKKPSLVIFYCETDRCNHKGMIDA